jgi:hypothetical protein
MSQNIKNQDWLFGRPNDIALLFSKKGTSFMKKKSTKYSQLIFWQHI